MVTALCYAEDPSLLTTISTADMKKIYRLMTPREDGSYLIPEKLVQMWKDTRDGGRDEVKKLWMECRGEKDCTLGAAQHICQHPATSCQLLHPPIYVLCAGCFRQALQTVVESISENDLWVDGAYMSEKDMANEGIDASFGGN